MDDHEEPEPERRSRSARRREALDTLAFAEKLSELPATQLDKLGLPDAVREALANVRATPSHIAHKRATAHLAKLIRAHDAEAFATARAALARHHAARAHDAAALHRVESLREQLLGEAGDGALAAFISAHPAIDRQRLRKLIRQSRRERETGTPPRAQRTLFRLLRDESDAAAGQRGSG